MAMVGTALARGVARLLGWIGGRRRPRIGRLPARPPAPPRAHPPVADVDAGRDDGADPPAVPEDAWWGQRLNPWG